MKSTGVGAGLLLDDVRCNFAYASGDLDEVARQEHAKTGLFECERHGCWHLYWLTEFAKSALCAGQRTRSPQQEAHLHALRDADRERYLLHHIRVLKQGRVERVQALIDEVGVATDLLDEFYSCYRKLRYATSQQAEIEASKLESLNNRGGKLVAYRCSHCDNWHVGHAGQTTAKDKSDLSRWHQAARMLRAGGPEAVRFCAEKGIKVAVSDAKL